MNILLAGILLTNLIFLVGFCFAFFKIRSIYREIIDFITPMADNQPSKFASVCEALSEMIGRSLVASLKGFLMGAKSGEVRAANAEVGAGIDQSVLGGIVSMLPKSVRSSLIKNPQLLDLAMNFMAKNKAGSGTMAGDNHRDTSQAKFSL